MIFSRWIDQLFRGPSSTRRRVSGTHRRRVPKIEVLEDRIVPTGRVLTVDNLNDTKAPSVGSLRYELGVNAADGGGDTIVFEPTLQGIITLNPAYGPLQITAPVTIDGNLSAAGQPTISVSGNNAIQDFNINPNLSGGVVFKNLGIVNGTTNSGGGVFIGAKDTVAFQDVDIDGNSANNGGGVYVSSGANVYFTNSTIANNLANGPTGDQGAGVFMATNKGAEPSAVKVWNSAIQGNAANASGGGFYVQTAGNLAIYTVNESGIIDPDTGQPLSSEGDISPSEVNDKNSAGTTGGGIYSLGFVDLENVLLNDNVAATYGGGVFNTTSASGTGSGPYTASLTINDSTVDGNSAGKTGGGIYAQGNVTITNSEVGHNTASTSGGGILLAPSTKTATSTTNLNNVVVDFNTVTAAGGAAGGICNSGGILYIKNSTIDNNSATGECGGIRNDDSGTFDLINSTVALNNGGAGDGGGLLLDNGTIDIVNSTIDGNTTGSNNSGDGGGIMIEAPSSSFTPLSFTMQNSIVAQNTAAGGETYGPDIYTAAQNNNPGKAEFDTYLVNYSLIGDGNGTTINGQPIGINGKNPYGATQTGNLVGYETSATVILPLLSPLANNGGQNPTDDLNSPPTLGAGGSILNNGGKINTAQLTGVPVPMTMADSPSSPGYNAGNNGLAIDVSSSSSPQPALEYDERGQGFPRILGGIVDMGAYEYGTPITITPTTLPTAFIGKAYSEQITATGGSGSGFTYEILPASGSLPPGLTLSITGLISGTPTSDQNSPYAFTVEAIDKGTGETGQQAYSLVVDQQLTLTPTTLPSGTTGKLYSANLTAGGGSLSGYTFTETGTLPLGVSFANGDFSGTPAAGTAGNYPIQVTLTDSAGGSITQNYTIVIYNPLTLNPSTVPALAENSPYSVTFFGLGGAGGYTYTESGALPTGLTFSSGVLSGDDTTAGDIGKTFNFTVTVKDTAGHTVTNNYSITVEPAIVIDPSSLPNGEVGALYNQGTQFSASGGDDISYTFSESGTLPTGMSFNSGLAELQGTPSQSGTFSITITATDSDGATGSQKYTLTIVAGPTVSPATIPGGFEGSPYSETLTGTGGSGSGYSLSGPASEDGVTITYSGGTATMSGTPTAEGSFSFTVTVTDGAGGTGSKTYTLVVSPPLTLSPATVPWAAENGPYSVTFTASGGGGAPYSYALTWGVNGPAPGITTFSKGQLTGSAEVPNGSYPFTITVTDSKGGSVTDSYTLNVEGPISISPTSLPIGTVGNVYTMTSPLTPSGGNLGLPLTFTLSVSGSLPAGMYFDPTTREFGGTPTQYGTFPITVTAKDTNGGLGAQTYNLVINFSLGTSGAANFVTAVYKDLLDRAPDPGAQYWVNQLNNGASPASIVAAIEQSPEYDSDVVALIYEHDLGRVPDPSASGWVTDLENGASIESVTANILASQEFYARWGSTYQGFITGLYEDVLGRLPSATELAGWVDTIQRNGGTGVSANLRYEIAMEFLTSTEYRTDLLAGGGIWNGTLPVYPWAGYYHEFLERAADQGGVSSWLKAFAAGMSDQQILAAIFGSTEGYDVNSK